MTTTFQSRELVRDELVALFVANGSWQDVYAYFPSVNAFSGLSPILIVRGAGSSVAMEGLNTNPVEYRLSISSWVIAYVASEQTSAQSEDLVDTLDTTVRQVIRNNAGRLTNADSLRFEGGFSSKQDVVIEGLPYMAETRFVIARLNAGSV